MPEITVERRRYPRVAVNIVIEDIFMLDAFVSRQKGQITNISTGGVGVLIDDPIKLDTNIVFSFSLPNGVKINNIRGRVVRVIKEKDTWVHGIEFTKRGLLNSLKLLWYLALKKPPSESTS